MPFSLRLDDVIFQLPDNVLLQMNSRDFLVELCVDDRRANQSTYPFEKQPGQYQSLSILREGES